MNRLLSGSLVGLWVISSKRTYATSCTSQVCCSKSPCPSGRPLLTCASTGNTQALKLVWLSSGGVPGSWCPQGCVWALQASLEGKRFDFKCDFPCPTILLGLLLCPWMWCIVFWWDPTFSCQWLFSEWLVAILEFSQEKMNACPSTPPSWRGQCHSNPSLCLYH